MARTTYAIYDPKEKKFQGIIVADINPKTGKECEYHHATTIIPEQKAGKDAFFNEETKRWIYKDKPKTPTVEPLAEPQQTETAN